MRTWCHVRDAQPPRSALARAAALSLAVALSLALAPTLSARAAPVCAKWSSTNTAAEALATGLILTDWAQTLRFTEHPQFPGQHETNPLLGPHPSRRRVNSLIGAGVLAQFGIACALPDPERSRWLDALIAVEALAVAHNHVVSAAWRF